MDDIEESLSGRRLGTSGGHSQSAVTEETFRRSGSTASKSRQPASGSVATETAYSSEEQSRSEATAKPLRPRSGRLAPRECKQSRRVWMSSSVVGVGM